MQGVFFKKSPISLKKTCSIEHVFFSVQEESCISKGNLFYTSLNKTYSISLQRSPMSLQQSPASMYEKSPIKETIFCKRDLYFEGAYESFPPQKSCNVAGALIWQFPP